MLTIENSKAFISKSLLEQTKVWFTKISGKNTEERNTKQTEIKAVLGFSPDESIVMTREELYQKASELTGKDLATIVLEGADTYAQTLITTFRKPSSEFAKHGGRGRIGSKDEALAKALLTVVELINNGHYKPNKGKIPITMVATKTFPTITGANTALNWAIRNGLEFPLTTEDAIAWLTKNGLMEEGGYDF